MSKTWNSASSLTLNLFRIIAGEFGEAVRLLDSSQREGQSVVEGVLVLTQRKWIAEATDDPAAYERSVGACDDYPTYPYFPLWRIQVASWRDREEARRMLRRWAEEDRPMMPAFVAAAADAAACSILADLPEAVAAARCYEGLVPWAEFWPYPGPGELRGVGHHLLGLAARAMGRLDDSVNHLRRGLELHAASELPLFIAESHIELARTLVERDGPGDRDAARPHLDQTASIAGERGFRRVERFVGEVRAAI